MLVPSVSGIGARPCVVKLFLVCAKDVRLDRENTVAGPWGSRPSVGCVRISNDRKLQPLRVKNPVGEFLRLSSRESIGSQALKNWCLCFAVGKHCIDKHIQIHRGRNFRLEVALRPC